MQMLENAAKRRLREGKSICGFGVTMAAPGVAQVLAASGADFLTIDLEHGALEPSSAHALIAAMAGSACVPMVRVAATKGWAVKPVLDAGALGIVFPMIRSADELDEGIRAVLYPPAGQRGIGHHFAPARWGVTAADYLRGANDALLKIALIETREAVRDIEKILAVPGLDVATLAIGDLAASLGHPGDVQHEDVQKAVQAVEKAVSSTKVALGGVAFTAADVKRKLDKGYKLLVLGFDVGLLESAASVLVGAARA
ncbi:MAG TPA: aldolase/citrate lyase family protein [Usitatibacter sp.]|jgi:4-hydroxy-2-oxoheptanedioate aldolase|nr:aldolase/citrate lyase family protein [Usitatibacter sp.]